MLPTTAHALAAAFIAALAPASAAADIAGLNFVTVGDPGNAAYEDGPGLTPDINGRGSVGYHFRMSQTEITTTQYLEFLHAYAPHHAGGFTDREITGLNIRFLGVDGQGKPRYAPVPGREQWPVETSWFTAARFMNWLHNDKATTAAAFDSGAYDASQFAALRNGTYEGEFRRQPGARYWLPSIDEWLKAAYYDPNRFGEGEGGYWMYPNSSDTPPVSNIPGVGETSAGSIIFFLGGQQLVDQLSAVGLYPQTQSPWGLLDVSGTAPEWLELTDPFVPSEPFPGRSLFPRAGSETGVGFTDTEDLIWSSPGVSVGFRSFPTFRIATVIPSTGTFGVFAVWALSTCHRRRRSIKGS